jgi:hypothetical protein
MKSDEAAFWENVWQKMTPALVHEVIEFWSSNKMLRPDFDAEKRSRQVVFIIRSQSDKRIVGLSTVAEVKFKQLNSNNFYLFRSIILPSFRQRGLATKVIVATRNLLESLSSSDTHNLCIGMLVFVENPKLKQFKRETVWPASRMVFFGIDKEGRHIRVYYFEGARI